MKKRVVNIVDQSLAEVGLTLWGTSAETFDPAEDHPVIAVKGAKVTDYGGVSLTAWSSSVVEVSLFNFQNLDRIHSHFKGNFFIGSYPYKVLFCLDRLPSCHTDLVTKLLLLSCSVSSLSRFNQDEL
jgi:hypothetical protein